ENVTPQTGPHRCRAGPPGPPVRRSSAMSYVSPSELATKMIDSGAAKAFMSTRDTVIRAYMAGAILALAAAFAVTISVQTGEPLRSEERRVGKEGRSAWTQAPYKKHVVGI